MSIIRKKQLISNIDPNAFFNDVDKCIDDFQKEGLEVSIQFSTSPTFETIADRHIRQEIKYSAFIIARG